MSCYRRNARERQRAREVMKTLSEPMRGRIRAQQRYGRDTSPDLWGYYPRFPVDQRELDPEVRLRVFVEGYVGILKLSIIHADWRSAKYQALRLFEIVCEEEKRRWPSNVIDLAAYRRSLVEAGGPTS